MSNVVRFPESRRVRGHEDSMEPRLVAVAEALFAILLDARNLAEAKDFASDALSVVYDTKETAA